MDPKNLAYLAERKAGKPYAHKTGYQPIGGGYEYASLRNGISVRAPNGKEIYCQPGDDESAMRRFPAMRNADGFRMLVRKMGLLHGLSKKIKQCGSIEAASMAHSKNLL